VQVDIPETKKHSSNYKVLAMRIPDKNIIIVVVESTPHDREIFIQELQKTRFKHTVITVTSNHELNCYYNCQASIVPDIIFINPHLPAAGNIKSIRENRLFSGSTIVAYSNDLSEKESVAAFIAGANVCLNNSCSTLDLDQMLHTILSTYWRYKVLEFNNRNFILSIGVDR
jgi:DNA-binding NarL/FixJ family response regulator